VPFTRLIGRAGVPWYIFFRQRGGKEGWRRTGDMDSGSSLRRRCMGAGGGGVRGAKGWGDLRWRMERDALIGCQSA
jgi:hypothetical protein